MLGGVIVLVALFVIGLFVVYRAWLGYPPSRRAVIGRGEVAFLEAAAETFFPPGERMPVDGRAADLPGYADGYLVLLPTRQRYLIRALFVLFEQATLIFPARGVGAFRRFSSMSPEQRRAYLEGWATSRLYLRRMALDALKAVLIMGYLGHEENLRALGLAPWQIEPVVCEADLLYPPIGRPRSAVRYSRADLTHERPRARLREASAAGGQAP